MTADRNEIRDEVRAELNPADGGTPTEQPSALPDRPSDGASKAKWVDYVVAWGANRDHVLGESEHWDDERGAYVKAPVLTREQLIELADSLGG